MTDAEDLRSTTDSVGRNSHLLGTPSFVNSLDEDGGPETVEEPPYIVREESSGPVERDWVMIAFYGAYLGVGLYAIYDAARHLMAAARGSVDAR